MMANKTVAQRRAEQLGMSFGAARYQLVRSLLFELLQRFELAKCHVCQGEIGSEFDLSIEHIKPWENRENGRELYFDLENIAFSHRGCNRPHQYFQYERPEGMNRCSTCKQNKPLAEFHRNSAQKTGWQSQCKSCKSDADLRRRNRVE